MSDENVPKSRGPTAVLTAGLIGLWPILFILIMWALSQWGGAESEFSLAPRGTTRNVVVLVVALAATLALDVAVVVVGLRTLKRRAGRGRLIAGVIAAAAGAVAILLLVAAGIVLSIVFGRGGERLSREERIEKCQAHQRQIEIILGPELWGFDHPGAKAEDLKKLDLSPEGDLVKPDDGPAYSTDPTIFDCPADDDKEDVDYAVDITPEGETRVRCIDPAGIKEGHNRP